MALEHFFTCPHCWQRISMLLEAVEGEQRYVEDCEVCCNPIQLRYVCEGDELREFEATGLQQ